MVADSPPIIFPGKSSPGIIPHGIALDKTKLTLEVIMPSEKLKEYLDSNEVEYEVIEHPVKYSAQQVAAAAHISGQELAKTVIVKINGKPAMAVLPASRRVDFALLREIVGSDDVELAREHEFRNTFPDCDIGAMPPFGNLYGIDVYVAEALTVDEKIAFKACNHSELIRMDFADFQRLVNPIIIRFAMQ
jgi:Ala-tRNA(Pro) deacylase